jgi:hypothetical protein
MKSDVTYQRFNSSHVSTRSTIERTFGIGRRFNLMHSEVLWQAIFIYESIQKMRHFYGKGYNFEFYTILFSPWSIPLYLFCRWIPMADVLNTCESWFDPGHRALILVNKPRLKYIDIMTSNIYFWVNSENEAFLWKELQFWNLHNFIFIQFLDLFPCTCFVGKYQWVDPGHRALILVNKPRLK